MTQILSIPATLDLLAVQALRDTILQNLGQRAVTLDIEATTPSAISLQVFLAAHRSLSNMGQLAGLGPNGATLMSQVNH